MVEKEQLLHQFHDWVNFVPMLNDRDAGLWNSPIAEGKWAVRDVVSHIMHWDKYFLNEAIMKIAEEGRVATQHQDFDEFNEQARQIGWQVNINALAEQSIQVREQIIQQISSMSQEQYEGVYMDDDGNDFGLAQYLQDFIWHDQHHMKQIMDLLELNFHNSKGD